jgi:hypothetical protein
MYLQGVFMSMIKRISESELSYYLECPMRSIASINIPETPILTCSEETARWLIDEICAGRRPSAQETRAFFDSRWRETTYFQLMDRIPIKEYNRLMLEQVRICRRLRDVIWRNEIIQPVKPYELAVGNIVITGEYAVFGYARPKQNGFALYLRDQGVRLKPLVPDIVSFARHLDLSNRLMNPANRNWGIKKISVLHHWGTRDLTLRHNSNASFATDVLLGAAATISGHPFPIPGDRCRSCPTHACQMMDMDQKSAA